MYTSHWPEHRPGTRTSPLVAPEEFIQTLLTLVQHGQVSVIRGIYRDDTVKPPLVLSMTDVRRNNQQEGNPDQTYLTYSGWLIDPPAVTLTVEAPSTPTLWWSYTHQMTIEWSEKDVQSLLVKEKSDYRYVVDNPRNGQHFEFIYTLL